MQGFKKWKKWKLFDKNYILFPGHNVASKVEGFKKGHDVLEFYIGLGYNSHHHLYNIKQADT